MSLLLAHIAAGKPLEPPRIRVASDPDATAKLLSRIRESLHPSQQQFVDDQDHLILGYIGGFGSGKSYALAAKLIYLACANPGQQLMALEPTFAMLRTVLFPVLDQCFDDWGIQYGFRVSPQPEYLLHLPTGTTKVLCQSAENYQRIRGQTIAAAVWDEVDSLSGDSSTKCAEMLLARMRAAGSTVRQLAVAGTPEGYRWAYRTFVEQAGDDRREIKARTVDNPNLPVDFIESLRRNYPPQLIAAYLEGIYTNLASHSLYPDFDRSLNYSDAVPNHYDTIYIGVDINVGNSVTQHLIQRDNCYHFISESVYRDTQQMAAGLRDLYPQHFRLSRLVLVPDASARQRSTAAAQESDVSILKKAGHRVEPQMANPLVQDRINAMNVLIGTRRLKVGNRCPNLIRTLEQHAYDDKGKPEKGGVGMEDLSHAGDAAGYIIYRLARLTAYNSGNAMNLVGSR